MMFTSSGHWTLNEANLCKIDVLWYSFFTSISVFWNHFKSEEIIVPSSLVSVTISSRVFSRYSRVENWKSLVKLKIITLLFFTLSLDLLAWVQSSILCKYSWEWIMSLERYFWFIPMSDTTLFFEVLWAQSQEHEIELLQNREIINKFKSHFGGNMISIAIWTWFIL